jgi:hypothetical protein
LGIVQTGNKACVCSNLKGVELISRRKQYGYGNPSMLINEKGVSAFSFNVHSWDRNKKEGYSVNQFCVSGIKWGQRQRGR